MTNTTHILSKAEAWYIGMLLVGGDARVGESLEMLTGQAADRLTVRIKVIPASDVIRTMNITMGPLITVISNLSGDVHGEFLFLQTDRNYRILGGLMSEAVIGVTKEDENNPASYLVPDWLKKQRQKALEGDRGKKIMLDAISELSNMIFGSYGTALYDSRKLTIFQGVPTATLDNHHSALTAAIARCIKSANTAILFSIDFVMKQKDLKIWLLLLPDPEGLQRLLNQD